MQGTANILDLQKLHLPLCAAKARRNSTEMLSAGLALELEDTLATSAHCKVPAKCFFLILHTWAMQRCPKSLEHLIFFQLAGYIFATTFIPRSFCLNWLHHLSVSLMAIPVLGSSVVIPIQTHLSALCLQMGSKTPLRTLTAPPAAEWPHSCSLHLSCIWV